MSNDRLEHIQEEETNELEFDWIDWVPFSTSLSSNDHDNDSPQLRLPFLIRCINKKSSRESERKRCHSKVSKPRGAAALPLYATLKKPTPDSTSSRGTLLKQSRKTTANLKRDDSSSSEVDDESSGNASRDDDDDDDNNNDNNKKPSPFDMVPEGSKRKRKETSFYVNQVMKDAYSNGNKKKNEAAKKPPKRARPPRRKKAPPEPPTNKDEKIIPIRDYYHPGSFQKFSKEDYENYVDSADECDEVTWKKTIATKKMHDFNDITDEEKSIMILWNDFIRVKKRDLSVIKRQHFPVICGEFVRKYSKTAKERGLEEVFMFHMSNLVDLGLMSSDHLHSYMVLYHTINASPSNNKVG